MLPLGEVSGIPSELSLERIEHLGGETFLIFYLPRKIGDESHFDYFIYFLNGLEPPPRFDFIRKRADVQS